MFDSYGLVEHDHDYALLHTTNNHIINDDIETTLSRSIEHDHNYAVSFFDITQTIDDNIETTLSNNQSFGVLHYDNDEVITFIDVKFIVYVHSQ